MHGEFIIFNDEDQNGKVSGLRSQENREDEMKLILFFLTLRSET